MGSGMRCAVAFAAAAMLVAEPRPMSAEPTAIPLTLPSGKVLQAELKITDEERAMGLMFRPRLPRDRGLLFVFGEPDFHGIWMKNCRFRIDILWLDEERRVVHLEEAVPPCRKDPCAVYAPMRRASYVVELNARQARKEQAVVGSTLTFALPR